MSSIRFSSQIPCVFLLLAIFACSQQQPESERVGQKDSGASQKISSADGKGNDDSNGSDEEESDRDLDDSEGDDADERDSDGDDDDEQDSGDDDAASSGGCRSFSENFRTTTEIAGAVEVPILGSMDFKVDADTEVDVKARGTSASVKIDGTITNATPALAKSTAQKALDAYADPMKMKVLTEDEQGEISELEDLGCVVLAVESIESDSFAYEFEPALPFLVSPEADGAPKTEISVTSKLLRHYDTANGAEPGTYKGKARISSSGGAVRIDFDFGKGVPSIYAAPFAGLEFRPDGKGGFSRITAWVWITQDSKLPVVLNK